MAYRLKKIVYHERQCHIVLQNENGPCPLIAAANVMILRGAISLNSDAIRANVISTDELVCMLADWALSRTTASLPTLTAEAGIGEGLDEDVRFRQIQGQQHIHEVMELLPNLQFGLDVNPKFTNGPDSCEYTTALAVFDALGVDLVHGWLVDPQDVNTFNILLGKSYNQLTDLVIKGGEAGDEANKILEALRQKTTQLKRLQEVEEGEILNTTRINNLSVDWVEVSKETEIAALDAIGKRKTGQDKATGLLQNSQESKDMGKDPVFLNTEKNDILNGIMKDVKFLQDQLKLKQEAETTGHLIRAFLDDTSHQLTYYGLSKLHDYISEGQLCVFFRNSHFSTITKHRSHLFLLVTDLGYANVDEVTWEKIDNIHGDTDYADCSFMKPKPRLILTPTTPVLSPDIILAQKGQQDLDYQLALRISEGKALDDAALDEEEAALVAAATEASLHSYNAIEIEAWSESKPAARPVVSSDGNNSPENNNDADRDDDYRLAMQLQQEMMLDEASEALARQLDAEERITAVEQRNSRPGDIQSGNRAESKSKCIIS